jgi:hypothetical protein
LTNGIELLGQSRNFDNLPTKQKKAVNSISHAPSEKNEFPAQSAFDSKTTNQEIFEKPVILNNKSLYNQQKKQLLLRSQSLDKLPINCRFLKKQLISSQSDKTEIESPIETSKINLKITVSETRERIKTSQKIAFTEQMPSLTWAQRNTKKFAFLVGLTSCLSTLAAVKYWPAFASKVESWHSELYPYIKISAASLLKYASFLLSK